MEKQRPRLGSRAVIGGGNLRRFAWQNRHSVTMFAVELKAPADGEAVLSGLAAESRAVALLSSPQSFCRATNPGNQAVGLSAQVSQIWFLEIENSVQCFFCGTDAVDDGIN
jgi:hypothetical protein